MAAVVATELERVASRLRPYVREVECVVAEGRPAESIEAFARDRSVDLVVMGTHGRRGFTRAFLGSVAERVVRTSPVPVLTVPEYVATSRNDAGTRLAASLARLGLQNPNVVALSRGALTVATPIADALDGTLDLWLVEAAMNATGLAVGAVGENDLFALDEGVTLPDAEREEAVSFARQRVRSEIALLEGSRTVGDCWRRDVVLVADGIFGDAYARIAVDAFRHLGAAKVVVASPLVAHGAARALEGRVDGLCLFERSFVTDACRYRDDVLPSDIVARELLSGAPARRRSPR
jgi:predicted phosphoribosyltransferase